MEPSGDDPGALTPNLPERRRPLQWTIEGVTCRGYYWVDEHAVIHVSTEYGQNSTGGLRSGTDRQRRRENGKRAKALFETMIRGHLAGCKGP